MAEETTEPNKKELISNFLTERYRPAKGADDADMKLTTKEVCDGLMGVFPEDWVTEALVYMLLREQNYEVADVRQLELRWLISTRE